MKSTEPQTPSLSPDRSKDASAESRDFAELRDFDWPRIARLTDNLYAACFSAIKMIAARSILEDARRRGLLPPGSHVVESTSGTFGIALAMLRHEYRYGLTLVSDPAVDPLLALRFAEMGVRVEIVRTPLEGSYQFARLARLREILAETPNAFFTDQYHNPANLRGYATLADHFDARFGRIDCLIGTVGSGGSTSGTARRLRERHPALRVIGVDTPQSVLFGQPNGMRPLRGLGNSLLPANLDHRQFDQVHWVTAAEAYRATRALHARHGLFMGGTSGAAYLAARWHAARHPKERVLFLCPDDGYRYLETVYSDAFCATLPGAHHPQPDAPLRIGDPRASMAQWSVFDWNRRTLKEVLTAPWPDPA